MGEDGIGDAPHVLCARDEDRAMIFKRRRNAIPGFGNDEIVYGQRVDLAAIGAAVFDFGDSNGLVAAVSEPNVFSISVRYEGQSMKRAISWLIYGGPKSRSSLVQYHVLTHPKFPRSKGNLDFSSSLEA